MPPLKINILLNEVFLTSIFLVSLFFIVLISLYQLMYFFLSGFYLINQLVLLFKFLTFNLDFLSNVLPILSILLIILSFKYSYYIMILVIISIFIFLFGIMNNNINKIFLKSDLINLFLIPLLYFNIIKLKFFNFIIFVYYITSNIK